MAGTQGQGGKVAGALIAAALVAVPAIAIAAGSKSRPPAIALSFDRIASFTPASADPRLAAAFAGRTRALDDFKFTPAAAKGRPSQIRVAVRARSLAPASRRPIEVATAPPVSAFTPASFNLGAAVGWKRFAVAGDVAKISSPDAAIGNQKSAVVGVSYNLKKFTGRVALGAERNNGRIAALAQPDNVSVDVGAAYNISRRIAVTGGVRYRVDQDGVAALADKRRDSQAVYVGTAFKF
ncbi:MAG TPA: porin [Sphingomicrobium sp.]|nr:porin [Sphingomicrobium sp.]